MDRREAEALYNFNSLQIRLSRLRLDIQQLNLDVDHIRMEADAANFRTKAYASRADRSSNPDQADQLRARSRRYQLIYEEKKELLKVIKTGFAAIERDIARTKLQVSEAQNAVSTVRKQLRLGRQQGNEVVQAIISGNINPYRSGQFRTASGLRVQVRVAESCGLSHLYFGGSDGRPFGPRHGHYVIFVRGDLLGTFEYKRDPYTSRGPEHYHN